MNVSLKLTTVGNSVGVILPKEVLERLRVAKGDVLFLTETPSGFSLSPFDDEFSRQMSLAEEIMREDERRAIS